MRPMHGPRSTGELRRWRGPSDVSFRVVDEQLGDQVAWVERDRHLAQIPEFQGDAPRETRMDANCRRDDQSVPPPRRTTDDVRHEVAREPDEFEGLAEEELVRMKNDPLPQWNVEGQLGNTLAWAANCINQRLGGRLCQTEPRTQAYVDGGLSRAKLLCRLKDGRDHESILAFASKALQYRLYEEGAQCR